MHVTDDTAIQKYAKNRGCGIIGRKPHTMHTKKLIIMEMSILLNSFFPVRAMVRNTIVGPLLSHSLHNIAGVATLCGYGYI